MTTMPTAGAFAQPPFITQDHKAERDAFTSLALTMRRNSHAYRRWAREAEQRGDRPGYHHCMKEADRCWHSAKWNLSVAQREADYHAHFMETHSDHDQQHD